MKYCITGIRYGHRLGQSMGSVGLFCYSFFRFLCLKITRGWRVMNGTVLLQPDLWELKKRTIWGYCSTVAHSPSQDRALGSSQPDAICRRNKSFKNWTSFTAQGSTGNGNPMGISWEWDSHGMAIQLRNGNGRNENKHRWRGKLTPNSHWKKIPLIFLTVVDLH